MNRRAEDSSEDADLACRLRARARWLSERGRANDSELMSDAATHVDFLRDAITAGGGESPILAAPLPPSSAALKAALVALMDVAVGRAVHRNLGRCPDFLEGFDVRDRTCRACQAIERASALLARS
mgnify:CR=1 FL=1